MLLILNFQKHSEYQHLLFFPHSLHIYNVYIVVILASNWSIYACLLCMPYIFASKYDLMADLM